MRCFFEIICHELTWLFSVDAAVVLVEDEGLKLLIMDKKEHGKEASEDATRESLIAISDGAPDRTAKSIAGENIVEPLNCDADEKYRSKLISISSSTSPNVKEQPVMPGQPYP